MRASRLGKMESACEIHSDLHAVAVVGMVVGMAAGGGYDGMEVAANTGCAVVEALLAGKRSDQAPVLGCHC